MRTGLAHWFTIAHPRYRLLLVQLLVAGSVGSALAYLDNYLLSALTRSLTLAFNGHTGPASTGTDELGTPFVSLATALAISLPLAVLALFVLARLVSAGIAFWRARAAGALQIKSRNDLESEILVHLLQKDDAFFSSHSPAETVNRLTVDIFRVSQRRPNLMTVWWSALLIIGNLAFFLQRDWRLAIVGLASCAGGAWWTYRITRNVSTYDREFLSQDDQVKSKFEDLLRAAPEIQVGHLYGRVRAEFEGRQEGRTRLFARYVGLRAMLQVANIVSALLAFAAMIGILLWMSRDAAGRASALMLVPAVIWALPSLFQNAAELIFLHLDFQLAATSMERLLEYESARADGGATDTDSAAEGEESDGGTREATTDESLELSRASYQYTGPDGTRQGGVLGVSTTFEPGRWTAVVGGAGSGKSTVLKLLLGRFDPQEGTIRLGGVTLAELGPHSLARKLSLLPQALALLHTTIEKNLCFGRGGAMGQATAIDALDDEDMAVVEAVGLGAVCRLKALGRRVRAALTEECKVTIGAYEDASFDERHWLVESLVAGRCDRGRTAAKLLGPKGECRALRPLIGTALCDELAPFGQQVLLESQNLLRLANYALYSQLAPIPLDERIWQLRSSHLHLMEGTVPEGPDAAVLLAVALTSSPIECSEARAAGDLVASLTGQSHTAELDSLRESLGDGWAPFRADQVHPHLGWRENLVFGSLEVPNSRTGRLVDKTLLETLETMGMTQSFTRLGLQFGIGRQGGNLSGGQGQLVALCRTLLRRSPVLVLDEPTSALDPASRTKVSTFLTDWKAGRIVITVSHDPEFVRNADEVRLMESGRLVASGTFDSLLEDSEPFRNIMRQS
ncbi:MAG: ATP-binding cassette domain-containing protein [Deltaproteobacteria bacterium]|nr:ATP-binding cassette domain-containing protein [Deltaproteobacteria bacterium]